MKISRHGYVIVHFTIRDNENAYVSVNGKTCWSKTGLSGTSGKQKCGGFFKEERFKVRDCHVTVKRDMPSSVRIWTSLDSDALDESFAIDNVIIQPIRTSNFSGEQRAMP